MIIGRSATLLPFHRKYLDPTLRWINDPAIRLAIGTEAPVSDTEHERWYEQVLSDRSQRVFVIGGGQGEDALPAGVIGLRNVNLRYRSAEYWIYLGEATGRGRGLAVESSQLLLSFAFHTLGLNRVCLRVQASNTRAIRLYQRLGFVREGTGREEVFFGGKFGDMLHFSILAREWHAANALNTSTDTVLQECKV